MHEGLKHHGNDSLSIRFRDPPSLAPLPKSSKRVCVESDSAVGGTKRRGILRKGLRQILIAAISKLLLAAVSRTKKERKVQWAGHLDKLAHLDAP